MCKGFLKRLKDKVKKLLPAAAVSAVAVVSAFPASAAAATENSFTGILGEASTMFTWFISEMANLVTFILANPLVLAMFMILLCGSVVALFFRIWHNA